MPAETHAVREVLSELRQRLQRAHFTVRGIDLPAPAGEDPTLECQLHRVRILAERLNQLLPD